MLAARLLMALLGDVKRGGDLFVAQSLSDHLQDLRLPGGEDRFRFFFHIRITILPGKLGQYARGHGRREDRLARHHLAEQGKELAAIEVLEQVPGGATPEGLEQRLVLLDLHR